MPIDFNRETVQDLASKIYFCFQYQSLFRNRNWNSTKMFQLLLRSTSSSLKLIKKHDLFQKLGRLSARYLRLTRDVW